MKINHIVDELNKQQFDAAWITTPLNIYYLTGFRSEPHERLLALLIKPDGSKTLYCPQLEVEEAQQSGFDGKIIGYLDTENAYTKVPQTYPSMLIEYEHLTVKRQKELMDHFNATTFESIDTTLKHMRNIKDETEIAKLQRAAELADICIDIGKKYLRVGVTEREVVNHIEHQIKAYGIEQMSFDTMVLFGDHAASPHGTPGDRKLQDNEYVLFDLGVIYENYCSDITRTIPFGTPSDEAQRIYNVVLEAQQAAIDHIKPGVPIHEADNKARDIITNAGFGAFFPHRLGHGLGLEAHEYQDVSSSNTNVFEAGMVITAEPGIYVPGVAGVRIEDDILVTEDGCRLLTQYAK